MTQNFTRLAIIAILLGAAAPATAQSFGKLLSEQQARTRAIQILKGAPYGTASRDVAKNIKEVELITGGTSKCSDRKVNKPEWDFHVVVPAEKRTDGGEGPIDGWLVLDGRT